MKGFEALNRIPVALVGCRLCPDGSRAEKIAYLPLALTPVIASRHSGARTEYRGALVLTIFGYGQGPVMAPWSSAVLSAVKPVSAGAASGIDGTMAQIANAAGVAAIDAVFFAIESNQSRRLARLAALALHVLSIIA